MADTQKPPVFSMPSYHFERQHTRPLPSPIRLPPLNIPPISLRPELPHPQPLSQPSYPGPAFPRRHSHHTPYQSSAAPIEKLLSSHPYTPPRSSDPPYSPRARPQTRSLTEYVPLVSPRSEHESRLPAKPPAERSSPPGPPPKRSSVPLVSGAESFHKHALSLPSPSHSSGYVSAHPHHRHSGSSQYSDSSVPTSSHPETGPTRHRFEPSSVVQAPATEKAPRDYELLIRQQPIAARACGFGERDRRVIDPPPILELLVTDSRTGVRDTEELRYSLNVVHCTLWNAEGTNEETALVQPDRGTTRRLMGQLVSSPVVAKDEYDKEGCFFCFPDLSCRTHGRYRLRFVLMRIDPMNLHVGGFSPIITDVLSDVFTVYTAKDFPGMRPSSALTRALKLQGCNIQVKKGNDKTLTRKRDASSDNADEDQHDNEAGKAKRRRP